jgi:RHS repeat-associated protein
MQLSNGVRNIFAYDQNDRPIKITANKNSAIGNAVFSRTSTAYKTNGAQVTINQPRFESSAPGFGKAALIEYRTTVTPSNPFFKSGVTDWTLTTADGATATKASVTGGSFGGKTAKITITKGGTANNHIEFYKSIGSVTAGQQIACQIRIKSSVSTDKAVLQCMNNVSPGENFGNITLNLTTEFQRFEIIATSTLAGTARISLYLGNVPTGTAIEIDYIGCEIGRAYTTSPHDGSRSIENLKIPTAGISPTAGTWEQLVYINPVLKMKGTSRWDRIFSIPLPNGEPAICVYHDGVDGAWDLETHNDSGQGSWLPAMISDSVTNEGEWYRFRITWSPTQAVLQIYSVSSGSKVAEQKRTSPKLPTSFGPYAYVGNAGEHSFTNSIHDDIRVSSIVRTDVFDATKPLPVDENTIYKANLDDSLELLSGGLMNLNYEYDPIGNITRMNNDYFDYDGLNRLIWYGNAPDAFQSGANGIQWSYDGAGNMTGRLKYQNGQIQENITLGYDMANRLLNAGSITYTNSMVGERLTKTTGDVSWNYSYDGESRLTKVTKGSTALVEGFYDGAGMRYKKVENGKTTYYIYSGSNPLVEYTPTDGKYTYRIYAGKSAVAEEKGGVVKYFHKDHLGSTRVVTDANGNKVAEYKYAPYGEKEISTGNGTDYQFTDKANDESTGLTYFGARFYDPEVGRFISVDPGKDGLNWYTYANDNPLIFVDPDGRQVTLYIHSGDNLHGHVAINVNGTVYSYGRYGEMDRITSGLTGEGILRTYSEKDYLEKSKTSTIAQFDLKMSKAQEKSIEKYFQDKISSGTPKAGGYEIDKYNIRTNNCTTTTIKSLPNDWGWKSVLQISWAPADLQFGLSVLDPFTDDITGKDPIPAQSETDDDDDSSSWDSF